MSDHDAPRGSGGGWRGAELIGIVLIALGVIYLLGSFGIIRVAWDVIWPVLLIGVGGLILYSALRPTRRRPSTAAVARDASARLELDLSVGAGRFRLEGGATPANLVEVASTNEDIATRIDRNGDRAMVRLRQDVAWWPDAWRSVSDWSVRIASDVPTFLTMNAGAGDFQIDLSDVILAGARIQVGAAQARLVMPRPRGPIEIRVSGGATQLRFSAPPGVEYRVETSGGRVMRRRMTGCSSGSAAGPRRSRSADGGSGGRGLRRRRQPGGSGRFAGERLACQGIRLGVPPRRREAVGPGAQDFAQARRRGMGPGEVGRVGECREGGVGLAQLEPGSCQRRPAVDRGLGAARPLGPSDRRLGEDHRAIRVARRQRDLGLGIGEMG